MLPKTPHEAANRIKLVFNPNHQGDNVIKTIIKLSIAVITSLSLTGCIPFLIGAAVYANAQTDATKQKFLDDFNKTNLEREKAGLKPLEYCSELRRLDDTMAKNDDECKKLDALKAERAANPPAAPTFTQIIVTSDGLAPPAPIEPIPPIAPVPPVPPGPAAPAESTSK